MGRMHWCSARTVSAKGGRCFQRHGPRAFLGLVITSSIQIHQVVMVSSCHDRFDGQCHGALSTCGPDNVDRPPGVCTAGPHLSSAISSCCRLQIGLHGGSSKRHNRILSIFSASRTFCVLANPMGLLHPEERVLDDWQRAGARGVFNQQDDHSSLSRGQSLSG